MFFTIISMSASHELVMSNMRMSMFFQNMFLKNVCTCSLQTFQWVLLMNWLCQICEWACSLRTCSFRTCSLRTFNWAFLMNGLCQTCEWVTTHIWMSHVTHTGWRRLIGSPKLQIIFHKRATKHRSLLRNMTYKDKGSYESSPPCINDSSCSVPSLHALQAHATEART